MQMTRQGVQVNVCNRFREINGVVHSNIREGYIAT